MVRSLTMRPEVFGACCGFDPCTSPVSVPSDLVRGLQSDGVGTVNAGLTTGLSKHMRNSAPIIDSSGLDVGGLIVDD
jgi:hypothetical protein